MLKFLCSIAIVVAIGAGAASLVLKPAHRFGAPSSWELSLNGGESAELVAYDVAPVPVKQVKPDYPSRALRGGLEGTVYLKVHVGVEGLVKQAVVAYSDNPVFNQAAQIAAMRWEFAPGRLKDKPVDVWIPLPMRFKLKTL